MTQFGRVLAVTCADLLITQLRIKASIRRSSDSTQDSGTVEVYNLAPDRERLLRERAETIRVDGGYRGSIGVLFDGQVQRVVPDRKLRGGVARVTAIKLGDFTRSVAPTRGQPLGGISARSYAGPVAVRSIAADLASDVGLPLGPLDAIPGGATVSDWSWSGKGSDGLTLLLGTVDAAWYEHDGLIRVRKVGAGTQPDLGTLLITRHTGMVGIPVPTDEGVKVKTLLNPAVSVGVPIRVEADDLEGDYRVVAYSHQGDNWTGPFRTSIEARDQ